VKKNYYHVASKKETKAFEKSYCWKNYY